MTNLGRKLINKSSSVIRQKGESQIGSFKKIKHAKFSEKRAFLTPLIRTLTFWDSPFCFITDAFCIGQSKLFTFWSIPTHELTNFPERRIKRFNELKENGSGAGLTGDVFSTTHGDLVIELFKNKTKGTSDSFHYSFSTNINSVNTWVNTIYIQYISCLKLL